MVVREKKTSRKQKIRDTIAKKSHNSKAFTAQKFTTGNRWKTINLFITQIGTLKHSKKNWHVKKNRETINKINK